MNTEHKLTWIKENKIKNKHKGIKVAQVSCYVFTSDNKLILVSKNGKKWTITAGHTENKDKSLVDTAIREVAEEAGLDISNYKNDMKMSGYFIVETINTNTHDVVDKYIQARFFVRINESSSELILKPNERDDQEVKVRYAKTFTIQDAVKEVRWLSKSGDFLEIKKHLQF